MLYLTENSCDGCDAALRGVFDEVQVDRFWAFKTGRIKCRECGAISRPCNECFGTDIKDFCSCVNCPWNAAEVVSCMNEEGASRIKESEYEPMPVPYKVIGI